MISTVEVLKLMEVFVNESNYTVWSDLSCNLGVLSSLLSHTDFHEEIQEFIRDLFTPIGLELGWDSKPGEGEEELDTLSFTLNLHLTESSEICHSVTLHYFDSHSYSKLCFILFCLS